jgi:hypothetical protein
MGNMANFRGQRRAPSETEELEVPSPSKPHSPDMPTHPAAPSRADIRDIDQSTSPSLPDPPPMSRRHHHPLPRNPLPQSFAGERGAAGPHPRFHKARTWTPVASASAHTFPLVRSQRPVGVDLSTVLRGGEMPVKKKL